MDCCTLYRKYRPTSFGEIYGQNIAKRILLNSIIKGKISQAYLFYGPRGTGKTSVARLFSKIVNCEELNKLEACGKCKNCLITNENEGIDIIEIDAASNNGVDEIRDLKSKINLVPNSLKYKIYIIDEVHMLSSGAFNALLKTLEEPPNYVIFILATTEIFKVPTTILSRCQTIEFKNIDFQSMKDRIVEISQKEKISITNNAIDEIIKNSNGGMRNAIGLLDELHSFSEKKIDVDDVKSIIGALSTNEINIFVNELYEHNLEQLLKKTENYFLNGYDLIKISSDIIYKIRNDMLKNNQYSLVETINKIIYYQEKMKNSENKKILFELMLVEISNQTDVRIKKMHKIENIKIIDKVGIDTCIKNRINNTLVNPTKKELNKIKFIWEKLNEYAFDKKYGSLICDLIDALPVASNNANIIVKSKYESIVEKINNNYIEYEKVLKKIFNISINIVAQSDENWQICKKEYLENIKNGVKYNYIEEKNIIEHSEIKNNKETTIKNKAVELFGNIVAEEE